MKSKLFLFVIFLFGFGVFILTQFQSQLLPEGEGIAEDVALVKVMDDRKSQVIDHFAYSLSYNDDWKLPNWVAYELTKSETFGDIERCNRFSPDPKVIGEAVEHGDYTNNQGKYDRGHMAPAADMKWSEQAMRESFYTTNICPQNANLNRGDWNDIEELVRDYAQQYGAVYVVCGPIVSDSPQYMGNHQKIAIPDAFYKAILRRKGDSWTTIGFVCNNEAGSKPLLYYVRTIDEIEEMAAIDLFYGLPDDIENAIESSDNTMDWTLQK